MRWSPEELIKRASADYGTAWMSTVDLIADNGYIPKERGSDHPLSGIAGRARAALLQQGYTETLLPLRMDEARLRRDAGPAAPLLLADTFRLLAANKRPPAHASDLLARIRVIAPTFTNERLAKLNTIIKSYCLGDTDAGKMLSQIVERTGVRMEQAPLIADAALGELETKELSAFLRPSMIPLWPATLAALSKREPLPLQRFSTGPVFNGNTSEHTISGAILGENISFDDGLGLVRAFLAVLGAEPRLEKRTCTSPFFIPGTETDLLVDRSPVGRFGLISPIVLSQHGIAVPVFAFELGLGRLATALHQTSSSEALHYPQFYGDWTLTDQQLASMITPAKPPSSWGIEIAAKIVKNCDTYAMQPAPCEFKLVEHELPDQKLEVWLTSQKGTLCGRDYSQEVYVLDGDIIASPAMAQDNKRRTAVAKGVKTRISLLKSFADSVASQIEADLKVARYSVTELASPDQVGIIVPDLVRDYAKKKGKELLFAGAFNITVETRTKPIWRYEQPR